MVKYTKLLRGCGLFAHLRWEEGLGVSSGKRIDLSLARFANLLSLPPSAAVACLHREESWGTEAGAKWTLSVPWASVAAGAATAFFDLLTVFRPGEWV